MIPTMRWVATAIALAWSVHGSEANIPQSTSEMTIQEIRAELSKICTIPEIKAKISPVEKVCEVSIDNGKTWMVLGGAALATLIASSTIYMLRRRKVEPVEPKMTNTLLLAAPESDIYWSVENIDQLIDSNTIIATSDGWKKRMDDYVCSHRDGDTMTIVVLDGVGGGGNQTPEFVANIGTHLKDMSVQALIDKQRVIKKPFQEMQGMATTIGRAQINGNMLNIEKLGDIWVVVVSQVGSIIYSNIGGWYILDSWYGSSIPATKEEKDIIYKKIAIDFSTPPNLRDAVTRGDVMRLAWYYTPQFSSEQDYTHRVSSYQMKLDSWDIVIMATDGLWDNMTVAIAVAEVIGNMIDPAQRLLEVLNSYQKEWQWNFWTYKVDNIWIAVYNHP